METNKLTLLIVIIVLIVWTGLSILFIVYVKKRNKERMKLIQERKTKETQKEEIQ
jgi:hypothetical protein